MTLEELKAEMVNLIDKAWSALSGTADVETARAVVADTTTALSGHVTAAGQQLYDHVVANAAPAADETPQAPAEQPSPAAPEVAEPPAEPVAEHDTEAPAV